ncbi:hypothetical protein JQ608_06890 [Bradyrhizobium liaoningense]|uniref:hypothetical protein n=1 Tax=Bradyrhizobium liaoningense TaxID=43992 RepID=UPI001BAB2B41|nr:hypothetical protein [Bradyrhizobium liaoningense]MBR0876928.1 hypothetical protein [Bradyrhizobium liaoningense]
MRSAAELVIAALKRGKTNAEALAAAKRVHPHTNMSLPTINWYRNRLRAEGAKVPTEREARRKSSKKAF